MEIKKTSVSGTLESSDIMITLEKGNGGIEIELDSSVLKQFGDRIKTIIAETLMNEKITDVHVIAHDHGALDCTIRARVQAAILKASEEE